MVACALLLCTYTSTTCTEFKICLITCALCLIFFSVNSIIIIHFISALSHRRDLISCAHVGSFSFGSACARDACALLTVMFTTLSQPYEGGERPWIFIMGKFNENIFITRVHVHQAIGIRLTLVNSTLCMNLNPIRSRSLYQNDAQAILRLKSATVSRANDERERKS